MPVGIDKDQVVAVASLIHRPLQTSHLLIRNYPVVLSDNEFSLSPLFKFGTLGRIVTLLVTVETGNMAQVFTS